jgi:alkanesulfonate monooxygenase SsuD/methylene tetrahydromethanopterin reductase-like flavin-dependent oxidoreductase (luciferase family)
MDTELARANPGRVDLGIGRAGGPPDTFTAKLQTLQQTLRQQRADRPADHDPQMWLLGTSAGSAELAAAAGLHYCFGHFLNPGAATTALHHFQQRKTSTPPILALRVFVASTNAAAQAQAADYLLWRSRKDLGANEPLPPPAAAATHQWTAQEHGRRDANRHAILAGNPNTSVTSSAPSPKGTK